MSLDGSDAVGLGPMRIRSRFHPISLVEETASVAAILMLFGLKSYTKKVLREVHLPGGLARVWVELEHESGATTYGAAEWPTAVGAKLRAFAESYERLAALLAEKHLGFQRDTSRPVGYGVGWTFAQAKARAIGEHFERSECTNLHELARASAGKSIVLTTRRDGVEVHCASLSDATGIVGTGYGTKRRDAEFSALRSLRRIQDHGPASKEFPNGPENPTTVRITPTGKDKWLEVAFFGDLNIPGH